MLPQCYVCRRISNMYHTHSNCLTSRHPFNQIFVGWRYNEIGKRILSNYKYYGAYRVSKVICNLLLSRKPVFTLLSDKKTIVLTVIPLHKKREKQRGFNQSELIATDLVKNLHRDKNLIYIPDLLVRRKNNPHQASLSRKKRVANVYNLFEVNQIYCNRLSTTTSVNPLTPTKKGHDPVIIDRIVVIDDVLTTGSTIDAAGKCLKKQWPDVKLSGLCLFRGKPYHYTIKKQEAKALI